MPGGQDGDVGLQVDVESEDAVRKKLAGHFREEAPDRVRPGTGGLREVEGPSIALRQPARTFGCS